MNEVIKSNLGHIVWSLLWLTSVGNCAFAQQRRDISLDKGWTSVANDTDRQAYAGFEAPGYNDKVWSHVDVPHNWDEYEGYRRLLHGNRHGYAWYRKIFTLSSPQKSQRCFLFFEGVGSYATVWLNGVQVGYHAGGRTTFTIDATKAIRMGTNILAVRADHPADITDLPWVCGGCSPERGFSEGSQPMGIFRPVHLILTRDVRIEPFGVHVWNDTTVSASSAELFLETTIRNYSETPRQLTVVSRLVDRNGKTEATANSALSIPAGQSVNLTGQHLSVLHPHLWSLESPYLYKVISRITEKGIGIDQVVTTYGIRWVSWEASGKHRFLLNGHPVFINGIAEYEHALGHSHALTAEEIRSRAMMIREAGFNAFRDAHQPHNLRYQEYWDQWGMLWWPQFSAHIWFDSPAFRENFKTLLADWIRERRNSPSVILWGLQNESKLPADFARECVAIIRQLDPTASSQRKITTCNGGQGTDWDVPQNWTGTYGGNPYTYGADLRKQVLVGEYGAWRTADLHDETPFSPGGATGNVALGASAGALADAYSEERMEQLLEIKLRAADSARGEAAGQFFWLFSSHDNPGRVQGGEGLRELDRIGPVNYKGLLTEWGEPLDAYYMFRAHYVPEDRGAMVYIVSHTWPDRWLRPGKKSGIVVYSNCDEVELFNDANGHSLGRKRRTEGPEGDPGGHAVSGDHAAFGGHFQWDNVNIAYNVLYAVGYAHGRIVAKDSIVLRHLPPAPHFAALYGLPDHGGAVALSGSPAHGRPITGPAPGYRYWYRVHCGGPDYTDRQGYTWMADRALTLGAGTSGAAVTTPSGVVPSDTAPVPSDTAAAEPTWGSSSWTDDYPGMPAFFASQRRISDPVKGTMDWPLFQTFRYGRDKLRYTFPVPDGDYRVELYFVEPWIGIGGGVDGSGRRLFDVAINNRTVLRDLDIWKEVGTHTALRKIIPVRVTDGRIVISFPRVTVGQAVISAIAIASKQGEKVTGNPVSGPVHPLASGPVYPASSTPLIRELRASPSWSIQDWMDDGDRQYTDTDISFSSLPPILYGAEWLRGPANLSGGYGPRFTAGEAADVYIALDSAIGEGPGWMKDYADIHSFLRSDQGGGRCFKVYRKRFAKGAEVVLGDKDYIVTPPGAAQYTIAVCPVTAGLAPAYDLKPVTSYRADSARLSSAGVSRRVVYGKSAIEFAGSPTAANTPAVNKNGSPGSAAWDISVGVADTYSLTFRYADTVGGKRTLLMEIIDVSGTVLRKEHLVFSVSVAGKWGYVTTDTGGMINAGRYTVRLRAIGSEGATDPKATAGAEGLILSGLDIQ
jgi:beta-galactosidase